MNTKRIAIALTSAAAVSFSAASQAQSTEASEGSAFIVASVVVAGSITLATPLILSVTAVDAASNNANNMRVCATDREGRSHVVDIPRRTVQNLGIQPGDHLTTTPREGGAMLEKQGRPVAFLLAPSNANLVHSHELAQ